MRSQGIREPCHKMRSPPLEVCGTVDFDVAGSMTSSIDRVNVFGMCLGERYRLGYGSWVDGGAISWFMPPMLRLLCASGDWNRRVCASCKHATVSKRTYFFNTTSPFTTKAMAALGWSVG